MGNNVAKEHSSFKENLLGKTAIEPTSKFWDSLCSITFYKNSEFLLSYQELSGLLDDNPANYHNLMLKLVEYVGESIKEQYLELSLISRVIVAIKIISRMLSISFLPERKNTEESLWLSGISEKIMNFFLNVFFVEGFTTCNYVPNADVPCDSSSVTLASIQATTLSEIGTFEIVNRTHCLCFLIMSFSSVIYYPYKDLETFYDKWVDEFYRRLWKAPKSRNVLLHLMNSAFSYKSPKWRLIGDSKNTASIKARYLTTCLQAILIMLHHNSNASSAPISMEYVKERIDSIVESENDAVFILDGLLNISEIYFSDEESAERFSAESLIILLDLIMCSKIVRRTFYKSRKYTGIVGWIIKIILGLYSKLHNHELLYICISIICVMSKERGFGLFLETPFDYGKFKDVISHYFDLEDNCTWADVFVSTVVYVIVSPNRPIGIEMLNNLIIAMSNISPYIRNLKKLSSKRIMFLIRYLEAPNVAMASPEVQICLKFALLTCLNIIELQLHSNPTFVIFLYKNKDVFESIKDHNYSYYVNALLGMVESMPSSKNQQAPTVNNTQDGSDTQHTKDILVDTENTVAHQNSLSQADISHNMLTQPSNSLSGPAQPLPYVQPSNLFNAPSAYDSENSIRRQMSAGLNYSDSNVPTQKDIYGNAYHMDQQTAGQAALNQQPEFPDKPRPSSKNVVPEHGGCYHSLDTKYAYHQVNPSASIVNDVHLTNNEDPRRISNANDLSINSHNRPEGPVSYNNSTGAENTAGQHNSCEHHDIRVHATNTPSQFPHKGYSIAEKIIPLLQKKDLRNPPYLMSEQEFEALRSDLPLNVIITFLRSLHAELLASIHDPTNDILLESLMKNFNFAGLAPPSGPIKTTNYIFESKFACWIKSYIWSCICTMNEDCYEYDNSIHTFPYSLVGPHIKLFNCANAWEDGASS